ncbi:WD40 repeat-like protein [Lichtheimia hyalospora FSU 10163]|nr:WD40 repeat-like protein [Lichtheimia hyalospora FSU 10163]
MGDIVAEYKGALITNDADVKRYNIPIQPSITLDTVSPLDPENEREEFTMDVVNMLTSFPQHAVQQLTGVKDMVADRLGDSPWLKTIFWGIDKVGEAISKVITSTEELTAKHSEAKLLAWHPHRNMLAIAYQDNTVHVYERTDENSEWTCHLLQHRFMKKITCLEWKKRARGTLAVGCRNGVCVWSLASGSVTNADLTNKLEPYNRHTSSMNYLCHTGYGPISSLAWDPSPASHLLAVTSATKGTLVIYDTMTLSTTPLKRQGKGNTLLRWSPDGAWLFVASDKHVKSRMWDTRYWTHRDLTNPPGLGVQSACWAPDSRNLFISMHGKSDIHLIYWANTTSAAELKQEKVYSVKAPVQGPAAHMNHNHIREIALSPSDGKRLAVIFEKSDCVALYTVQLETMPTLARKDVLQHIGIANTRTSLNDSGKPIHIAYSAHSSSSTTLAVLHKTGVVDFITQVA